MWLVIYFKSTFKYCNVAPNWYWIQNIVILWNSNLLIVRSCWHQGRKPQQLTRRENIIFWLCLKYLCANLLCLNLMVSPTSPFHLSNFFFFLGPIIFLHLSNSLSSFNNTYYRSTNISEFLQFANGCLNLNHITWVNHILIVIGIHNYVIAYILLS